MNETKNNSVKALKKTDGSSCCHGMRCRCSTRIKYVCLVCNE